MYEKEIKLSAEGGRLRGFSILEIEVAIPETLCKTNLYLYREASADETRNVDGCFIEAPASAKPAGVPHN